MNSYDIFWLAALDEPKDGTFFLRTQVGQQQEAASPFQATVDTSGDAALSMEGKDEERVTRLCPWRIYLGVPI